MVNFPLCHSVHSNRLFWRVDENTLIGRFYLMHMVCIRPELTDFVVGSSCDYSFIPEMCPSGKVYVMTDSDDYLVVEMQKRSHERNFVRLGAVNQRCRGGKSRRMGDGDPSQECPFSGRLPRRRSAASSGYSRRGIGRLHRKIERSLPSPQPHRNHPYWLGAMAAHEWALRTEERTGQRTAVDMLNRASQGLTWWLYRFRNFVFGRPPQVRPWHPRWPDYRMFMDLAQRHFAGNGRIVADHFQRAGSIWQFSEAEYPSRLLHSTLSRFLTLNRDQYKPSRDNLRGACSCWEMTQINRAHDLISRIKPLFSGR